MSCFNTGFLITTKYLFYRNSDYGQTSESVHWSGQWVKYYLLFFLLSGWSRLLSARFREAKETLDTEKPLGRAPATWQKHKVKSGMRGRDRTSWCVWFGCCWPAVPTRGVDKSATSRWIDLGRGFFFRLPDRGLMTSSMSSISLSCFLLRYSFLM